MRNIRFIIPLLGIVLFTYLISRLSWQKILINVSELEWWQLLLPALCAASGIFIKSLRWSYLINCKVEQRKQARDIFLASIFYGMVTPGRIGEFVKIEYLKDLGYEYKRGLFYTIYDRIFDVIILLISSALTGYVFGFYSSWLLLMVLFILVLGFVLHRKLAFFMNESVSWIRYLKFLLLTVAAYVIYAIGILFILKIQDLVESIKTILVVFTGNLVSLIPVSIHGLGTRESVFFLFLDWLPNETLLVASLTHFFTTFIGTAIFCSLYLGVGLSKRSPLSSITPLPSD